MALVRPLQAFRVVSQEAAQVAAVPYDVVNRAEAKALAALSPDSFLHVTKPEIDLPEAVDGHAAQVYAQGARAWASLCERGIMRREAAPCYYVYELTQGAHRQTGVVLGASISEYERGVIRKHELTRPDKENDRVAHIEALRAQSGKAFFVHRDSPAVTRVVQAVTQSLPAIDFTAADQVQHRLWVVDAPLQQAAMTAAFAEAGPFTIADGHHRCAAAARVAQRYRAQVPPMGTGDAPWESLLGVAFPASEVQILAYNRVVRDWGDASATWFLEKLAAGFEVEARKPAVSMPGQLGMYLGGRWYSARLRQPSLTADAVHQLDVSILQDQVLGPLLGITDPRRDPRIDFVGGSRGDAELERRVDAGWAVAFALHPTRIDALLTIADAGGLMPPKSTWFEPKLRDGLVVLGL